MTRVTATAQARTASPARLAAAFRRHMLEHGRPIVGPEEDYRIAFPGGEARVTTAADGLALRLEAESVAALAEAQGVVAGHLDEFAPGERLGIAWAGAAAPRADARPANFRTARVLRVTEVTPRMRRLTLRGDDLARFDAEAMHLKIYIPGRRAPDGAEPRWPGLTPAGQPDFAGRDLTRRTYTIRRIDAAAGEMEIDFVVHGDGSPGSRFALRAEPGDWLGLSGPGGGHIPVRGWTLVGGDETALPAIARALEQMPRDARGQVLIEVADAAERQTLSPPPGMAVRWLLRDGAPHGAPLLDAVRALSWPAGEAGRSAWVACEAETARQLRQHFSEACGLPAGQFRAAGYWRQGVAEGGH
ncbi:DUF2218 domain-containing protein [Teichococcus aerofrigidensis]